MSGVEAELLYAGPAPGVPGVMQINARIPGAATATVTLRVGAAETTSTITIQ